MQFNEIWAGTSSSIGVAARNGSIKDLKALLKSGRPVDVADNRGFYPIHEAVTSTAADSLECLKLLVSHEFTDVNWKTFENESALCLAVTNSKSIEKVRCLLQAGADPTLSAYNGFPLSRAINCGSLDIAKEILMYYKEAWQIDAKDDDCLTALHHASIKGDRKAVELVLEHGASLDPVDEFGRSAIMMAAYHGNFCCLKALITAVNNSNQDPARKHLILNKKTLDGATSLFLAAQSMSTDCVKLLLQNGADPAIHTDLDLAFPIHAAIQTNDIQSIKLLYNEAVNEKMLKICDHEAFNNPLKFAVIIQMDMCIDLLLEMNLSLNHQLTHFRDFTLAASHFHSLLSFPIHYKDFHILEKLLAAGFNPNPEKISDSMSFHPISAAILSECDFSYFELLLEHGSDLNFICDSLPVCLHAAASSVYYFKYILRIGANADLCLSSTCVTKFWLKDCLSDLLKTVKITKSDVVNCFEELLLHVGHTKDLNCFFRMCSAECDVKIPADVLSLKQLARITIRRTVLHHMKQHDIRLNRFKAILNHLQLPDGLSDFLYMS